MANFVELAGQTYYDDRPSTALFRLSSSLPPWRARGHGGPGLQDQVRVFRPSRQRATTAAGVADGPCRTRIRWVARVLWFAITARTRSTRMAAATPKLAGIEGLDVIDDIRPVIRFSRIRIVEE